MNTQAPCVVLVEDEDAIRRFVKMSLEAEGCQVFEAGTLKHGLIEAGTRRPDLVILDLGLPDGDGVDFIRDLRTWSDTPVIVLSARTAEAEKISALDAGADDYLSKPFGSGELLARVRAHLRRHRNLNSTATEIMESGHLKIDIGKRIVERGGEILHLTPIEFRLLSYLLNNRDCVLTHRQILKAVWGPAYIEHSHYVRIYMGQLRKKLEVDASRPQHLLTETGVGYRFIC